MTHPLDPRRLATLVAGALAVQAVAAPRGFVDPFVAEATFAVLAGDAAALLALLAIQLATARDPGGGGLASLEPWIGDAMLLRRLVAYCLAGEPACAGRRATLLAMPRRPEPGWALPLDDGTVLVSPADGVFLETGTPAP